MILLLNNIYYYTRAVNFNFSVHLQEERGDIKNEDITSKTMCGNEQTKNFLDFFDLF